MSTTVRIESDSASDLARVYVWLSRHRGQSVDLGNGSQTRLAGGGRLSFGIPMSGARAVISAVNLYLDGTEEPVLGGVLRALSNRTAGGPARLVFDGRSPARLPREEAQLTAAEMLDTIVELIAADDLVAEVA